MIDTCGLHIGCLLTCSSGENVYTVELLATVTGTHTIEYHFLSRVIRFEIEATIGQQFEIPTTYFNESGDARIKIILPSGAYYTHTVGTSVYDTFYLTVRSSQDANFIPVVAPLGVPFASQGYVDTAIAALGIPFTHSLVEQVWPFEKAVGGGTIYVRTFLISGVGSQQITGISSLDTFIVTNTPIKSISAPNEGSEYIDITVFGGGYFVAPTIFGDKHITVWYTKV